MNISKKVRILRKMNKTELMLIGTGILATVFVITLVLFKDSLYSQFYPNSVKTRAARQAKISDAKSYNIPTQFAINDNIETKKKTFVWNTSPLSKKYIGKQAKGAQGVVIDGPIHAADAWWWNIDFASGADGWTSEDWLKKVGGESPITPVPTRTVFSLQAPFIDDLSPAHRSRLSNRTLSITGRVVDFVSPASELTLKMDGTPIPLNADGSFSIKRKLEKSDTTFKFTTTGAEKNPRQQVNNITAFIDASLVYGSDPARAAALRTFTGGRMKVSEGNFLPYNTDELPNANDAHIFPNKELFVTGEIRANENIELTAIHTLFVREHNLIADAIAKKNPRASDETIYQFARQLVAAELQVITYKEFLPALLGTNPLKAYKGYKPDVNPGISNEFATAAFRIGHTLVNNDVEFFDNEGEELRDEMSLAEAFFNPQPIKEVGIDPLFKYLASDNTQEVDTKIVQGLRNFLFGPPGAGGLDLASLNIQRGRDHGIADLNNTRTAYGLPPYTDFTQITNNTALQDKLKELYGDINNIDLWVGGLAEDHVANASVGETFRKIISDQFERTRDGDRFWYQQIFSGRQLRALEATRLSDIIRRNTSITKLQDNVFFFYEDTTLPNLTEKTGTLPNDLIETRQWKQNSFASYDGSNNNESFPEWGKAGVDFVRLTKAAYSDGIASPAGPNRPSPRHISNMLSEQTAEESGEDAPRNNRDMSDWVYAWGQFIDHDLDLTTSGDMIFDIQVPTNDQYFDPEGTGEQVITLKRSNYDASTGTGITKTRDQKYKLYTSNYSNGKRVKMKGRSSIRSTPSTKAASVVQQTQDTDGTVLDGPIEAEGESWWRVYSNGKSGWIQESALSE